LIKTILALKHRLIPPSLHFRAPNPKLDLENSPFYVVSRLTPWKTGDNQPRRAGVSSLGIGGTNAHVIVEEAPIDYIHNIGDKPPTAGGKQRLILLSARTRTGLEQVARDLVNHLEDNPHIDFPGMAYTLQVGRRAFEYRKMTVCPDIRGTVENLSSTVPGKAPAAFCPGSSRGKIVFLFPGQGSQYVDMGLGLYKTQPVFREEMDRCFEILGPLTGCNPREIVYPPNGVNNPDRLNRTEIAQPLLFAVEYALAKLLIRWGIVPGAMMGHSIGEYTAAYFAGVFSLEDALKLVAARGRSMQGMPAGAMLGVPLSEEELVPLLKEYVDISIAAVNNTSRCVVSGPHDAVDAFEAHLKEKGCDTRRIHTSHAFHSRMMDPVLREFEEEVKRVPRSKPNVPYISNLSGHWIKDREVVDPAYWSRHLRGTVRFSRGLDVLLKEEGAVFIEVGPGRALSTMVNRHEAKKDGQAAVTLLRHPGQDVPDDRFLLNGIGQLWLHGVDIHWPGLYPGEEISRISLPGYPFEKKRFWLDDGLFKKAVKMLTAFNVSPRAQAGDGEKYAVPFETGPSTGFILEEFQAPRNEFEKKIAGIWEEVLGFEQVGIFHNFFDLNGDSLSATQVISRVKDTFGVDVPLKDFFVEPTVARLAQVVKTLLVEKIKNLSPEEKKKLAGSRAQI